MKNVRFGLITVAAGLLAICLPAKANATTFSFDLDCLFSGGSGNVSFNGTCSPVANQGNITYNNVTGDGTVDLVGAASGAKAFDLFLNLGNAGSLTGGSFVLTGTDLAAQNALTVNVDNVQADGNTSGFFDIDIAFKQSDNEPYTFNLVYKVGNTTIPIDLSGLSTDGKLKAAAHLGGFAGGCSEWVGDLNTTDTTGNGTTGLCGGDGGSNGLSVPEPASMLLFGLGSVALAARVRRRQNL